MPLVATSLLARALASESGANSISVDGPYFTAMFCGAGVSKVKKLFSLPRKNAPCLLLIDDIDGIGKRTRGAGGGGVN